MEDINWINFLSQWSLEIINSGRFLEAEYSYSNIPSEIKQTKWLGFAPASDEEISQAEIRLGINLPPSYREFLKTSNGWRQTTLEVWRVWPAEEIDWYQVINRDSIEKIEELKKAGYIQALPPIPNELYFDYDNQEPALYREEDLRASLQISEKGDIIYLLNPKVVTANGEWEAWVYSFAELGARRYLSFTELMQAEHKKFLDSLNDPAQNVKL